MSDHPASHDVSQSYIYAAALLLSFLLEAIWPALTPLMGIMQVVCLIGILVFGPLELYQLCRSEKA